MYTQFIPGLDPADLARAAEFARADMHRERTERTTTTTRAHVATKGINGRESHSASIDKYASRFGTPGIRQRRAGSGDTGWSHGR